MDAIGERFIAKSRRYLTGSYLPKLERALATATDDDVWWRPNAASNSVGNLVLHLAGSVRYWVVSVAGGAPSDRVRESEFAASDGLTRDELVEALRAAVGQADDVLSRLDPAKLNERREADDREITVLDAVYHAVEHFAMHTGQVLQLVKQRTGEDLRLTE